MAHQIFRIKKAFTVKDAPEIMKQNCLIFMESGHNRVANNIIQRNEDYIREKMSHMVEKQFGEYGIKEPAQFIYMPELAQEREKKIRYYAPAYNILAPVPALPTNALAMFLNYGNISPCFFRYEGWTKDKDNNSINPVFSIYFFCCDTMEDGPSMIDHLFSIYDDIDKKKREEEERLAEIEEQMAFACNSPEDSGDRFCRIPDKMQRPEDADDVDKASRITDFDLSPAFNENSTADERFDHDTQQLMKEVWEKINQLRLNGVDEWIIQQLALPHNRLSRLVVTKDFKIILPDYNYMEIKMEPIVKSVFLLFLENEEGIPFKCLSDYRERLTTIYNKVKEYTNDGTRLSADRVWQTIYNLTNPLSNSINEKCTRIKEAFLSQFDEHLANYYYITGKRGEAKKIALPRKLIEIQCEL